MYKLTLNKVLLVLVGLFALTGCETSEKSSENSAEIQTICNPLNLSYRFMPEGVSRREAADPTVIIFKHEYYLFASKSGGYWYSADLVDWTFVETNQIPTEEYAPTAIVLNDEVYFLASSKEKSTIYKSKDPKSGVWEVAKEELQVPVWDPAFYLDDDNKLYLYWGCSNKEPIYGVEIDQNDFDFIGDIQELIFPNPANFGWEIRGDYNTRKDEAPWLEGAWMNKVNGKYYLQYSAPGTLEKSYCDGVYVADNPLGPYTAQKHNAFVSKPEGFACGGGHGNTFQDKYGNYWHVGTITISVKDKFERRIAMYPTYFDVDGTLYSNTTFGDFPMVVPNKKVTSFEELQPQWMLLSYKKPIEVSSTLENYAADNANDEEIRTYWSAATGNADEWLQIDLEQLSTVHAIQVNFAEQNTALYGRMKDIYHQYVVEISKDGEQWGTLVDKSANTSDVPHDYIQLPTAVETRYVRLMNKHTPDGNFAVADLRVFGNASSPELDSAIELTGERSTTDRRDVHLQWTADENALGYNIKFGVQPDELYRNYQVLEGDTLTIRSLDANQKYYFRIDSFNENSTQEGSSILEVE